MAKFLFIIEIILIQAYTASAQTKLDSIVRDIETNVHIAITSLNKIITDKCAKEAKPMENSLEKIINSLSFCSKKDTAVFSLIEMYFGSNVGNGLIINEDKVVEHSLHYFVAAMAECRFLIDYKMNIDSWNRHLYESIDHYNNIDTVVAKQKINEYRQMVCNDYGKQSIEYFFATDIMLNISGNYDLTQV